MSVLGAADALEDRDHDFFLFHDADADAVMYWRDDGLLAVIQQWAVPTADHGPVSEQSRFSSPIDLRTAVAQMDAVDHHLLFFEDATT